MTGCRRGSVARSRSERSLGHAVAVGKSAGVPHLHGVQALEKAGFRIVKQGGSRRRYEFLQFDACVCDRVQALPPLFGQAPAEHAPHWLRIDAAN